MNRWKIQQHDVEESKALAKKLDVSELIASLLIARGYSDFESARKFLNPVYEDLNEPNLLKGLDKTVKRIFEAIDNGEKILVWGDYDVDGTTGTVVLRKAISMLGGISGYHVPHRFREGYGINIPELKKAKEDGYSLVISVDCGITAFEPAKWAKENGVDLIITDHHLPKEKGNPDAYAVVNPNQAECEYPDKHLAGVGVAFKLVHALLRERGREDMVPHFLKMVAIGTVADVMKLTGENRAIVSIGLEDLPNARNFGLKALMEISDCTSDMTSMDIGFRIGPRINAAGRMDAAKHVVELFETQEYSRARKLSEYLDKKNNERKRVQMEITERALLEAEISGDPNFIVVSGEDWHRGVIGLAASRIVERLYRPTLVLSIDEDGVAHGSGRSIPGYHLLSGLDSAAEILENYGGHAAAAGLKIKVENIEELKSLLNKHATENISEEEFIPEIRIDAEVSDKKLNLDLVNELKRLEPFGQGNPKPVFATRGFEINAEPRILAEKHLKLFLTGESGNRFEAVWWGGVEKSEGQTLSAGSRIELAYVAESNTWQGRTKMQLNIKDVRSS